MTTHMAHLRLIAVLGPILFLLTVGFYLTLRSGVVKFNSMTGLRQAAGNLSRAILLLAGCLFGLVLIQQIVGYKLGLGLL